MSGDFSFPPPPPPPPKTSPSTPNQHGHEHWDLARVPNGRGRGGNRGGQRGSGQFRGRGNGFPQPAHQRGGFYPGGQTDGSPTNISIQPSKSQKNYQIPNQPYSNRPSPEVSHHPGVQSSLDATSHPRTAAGQKRKLEALKGSNERPKRPGPPTAPAVPSFGAPILPQKPLGLSTSVPPKPGHATAKSKGRSLGLIPSTHKTELVESESDHDDLDEEAMYAELGNKLTFEHNGVVMSLKSQADLVAWKKERQKNWPTKARMFEKHEERRQVGEERRRLLRSSAPPPQSQNPPKSRATLATGKGIPELPAVHPEERAKILSDLRKKALQSQANSREAQVHEEKTGLNTASGELTANTPARSQDESIGGIIVDSELNSNVGAECEAVSDASDARQSESSPDSSSASTSASDSDDDAPEEVTSKPSQAQTQFEARPVCNFFAARGYCKYGEACVFKHEKSMEAQKASRRVQRDQIGHIQTAKSVAQGSNARKGIFQLLKEREQAEEDRMALQVIKHLGRKGFFSGSSAMDENDAGV